MPGMRAAGPRSNVITGALRNSILDGASHSAVPGLTRNYVVPFALTLQATTAQIGVLASVPDPTMALSRLAAPARFGPPGSRQCWMIADLDSQAVRHGECRITGSQVRGVPEKPVPVLTALEVPRFLSKWVSMLDRLVQFP